MVFLHDFLRSFRIETLKRIDHEGSKDLDLGSKTSSVILTTDLGTATHSVRQFSPQKKRAFTAHLGRHHSNHTLRRAKSITKKTSPRHDHSTPITTPTPSSNYYLVLLEEVQSHPSTMSENDKNNSRKRGVDALSVVLRHEESQELEGLRQEVKDLRILQALQIETAVRNDIHYWFAKVNDEQDTSTSIDTLKEMRDYILEHSVVIDTHQAAEPCRFSLVGGHYELMSSIIKACERYDHALASKGNEPDAVTPADWQWQREQAPAQLCHAQCLESEHLHVETRAITATRYQWVMDFPTVLVEAAAKGQDAGALAARRL